MSPLRDPERCIHLEPNFTAFKIHSHFVLTLLPGAHYINFLVVFGLLRSWNENAVMSSLQNSYRD